MPVSIPRPKRHPRPQPVKARGGFARASGLRLLPLVIVAALCLLGFRIQLVVGQFADVPGAAVLVERAAAFAAQSEVPVPAPAAPASDAPAESVVAPAAASGASMPGA